MTATLAPAGSAGVKVRVSASRRRAEAIRYLVAVTEVSFTSLSKKNRAVDTGLGAVTSSIAVVVPRRVPRAA